MVYEEITRLHQEGVNLWYDEGIEASNEWPEEIANAVLACGERSALRASALVALAVPVAAAARDADGRGARPHRGAGPFWAASR